MADLAGLLREHVDELSPDRLSLRLRLVDAAQRRVEAVCRARDVQVEPELPREHRLHFLGLAEPQKPVVHEDAVEAPADRPVEENRRD